MITGEQLPYAHARMPGVKRFVVVDVERGVSVRRVVEANATEGWYRQVITPLTPDPERPGHALTRTVHAAIEIINPGASADVQAEKVRRAEAKRARKAAKLRAAVKGDIA